MVCQTRGVSRTLRSMKTAKSIKESARDIAAHST